MKRSEQITVKAEPFELTIPDTFKVMPVTMVDLPSGCKADIYDTQVRITDIVDGKDIHAYKSGWRILTVNKAGRPPRALDGHYKSDLGGTDFTTSNPLDVKRHLEAVAWKLAKKNKTVVEDTDPED